MLFRSLPYGDSSRLVYLYLPNPNLKELPPEALGPSNPDFFDLRDQSRSFSAMTFFDQKSLNLNAGGQPERVGAAQVNSSFFHTLEVAPLIGREFSAADEEPGNSNVIILNYALWQSLFDRAPVVLNRSVTLNDKTYRIVGVMPPGFGYPHHSDLSYGNGSIETTQVWVPYALTAQQRADRDNTSINALARLAPGVALKDAQAEMSAIVKRLEPLHKGLLFTGMTTLVKPLNKQVLSPVRPLMLLLLAAVGFVLLIACGNAANLLLARAANRRHELGVRATLGARRGRLLRQMLTESLLLGSAAGIVGIGIAYLFIRALLRLNPGNIPHMESASLDLRALAFLVLVSLITSVVFGILPALSATRINLAEFLAGAGTRGLVADRRRTRRMLVTAQVALVVVLLVGAGLFLHSYLNVLSVETGFSPSTITVNVPIGPAYNTVEKRRAFYATLLERISTQHGIDSAGLVNSLPLTDSEAFSTLWVDGYPNHDHQIVEARDITSGYLTAMQTPLLKGRNFTADEDSPAKHSLVIVNQTFVNKFFPGKDPIGQRLRASTDVPWSTVIGVVRDIRNQSLETAAVPQIYIPFISSFPPPNGTDVAVRSSLPKAAIVSSIRAAVRSIDPGLAISDNVISSVLWNGDPSVGISIQSCMLRSSRSGRPSCQHYWVL